MRWYNTSSFEREDTILNIHEELILQDCPFCGGPGLLEEENGWCWYAICLDCGSQTAPFEYHRPEDRHAAAAKAAHLWNIGKVVRANPNE
jgi:hypothetical protein